MAHHSIMAVPRRASPRQASAPSPQHARQEPSHRAAPRRSAAPLRCMRARPACGPAPSSGGPGRDPPDALGRETSSGPSLPAAAARRPVSSNMMYSYGTNLFMKCLHHKNSFSAICFELRFHAVKDIEIN